MDLTVFGFLLQDGISTGAIYILIALTLVMVFTVTRIVYVPIGEIMVFAPFNLQWLIQGRTPGTGWLLIILGAIAFLEECYEAWRQKNSGNLLRAALLYLVTPAVLTFFLWVCSGPAIPFALKIVAACAVAIAISPILYRIAFQPIAASSPLALLIAAIALHFALAGISLYIFGPEAVRTPGLPGIAFNIGEIPVSYQSLLIIAACALLIVALFVFFGQTLYGKALRATAVSRRGARLVGIDTNTASLVTFTIAAVIAAFSGILIGPVSTLYYDSGFLLGLKGFVGATLGGLAIYPMAAAGALSISILEAFSSFWASVYKDVIVFTMLVPILLWRSAQHPANDEESSLD